MVEKNKFAEADLKDKNEQGDKGQVAMEDRQTDAPVAAEVVVEDKTGGQAAQPSELETKYRQLNDQYVRLAADFENYRKRMLEEHESLVKYGAAKSVTQLLPVLDNLERAAASLNENTDPKVLFKSFELMYKQLLDSFASMGVDKIQAVGQTFDPQFHEAASQVESVDHPENTVAAELQSGYTLNGKVLRPAMVTVSSGPPAGGNPEAEANPFKK